MKARTNNSNLLNQAVNDYNAGNYASAYHGYSEALAIELANNSPKSIYCEVGILQCQMMIGSLPYLDLVNTVYSLKDRVKQLPNNWWVEECRQILDTMSSNFTSSLFKMKYAYVAAARLHEAFQAKSFDGLFETVVFKSDGDKGRIDYFNGIIAALEYALHSSEAFCKKFKKFDSLNESKDLLALLYEDVADYYIDFVKNQNNHFGWVIQEWNGADPLFSLLDAKKLYDSAISIWRELGIAPSMELLFSPLCVANIAHGFFKHLPDNLKHFNIQEMIDKYALEKAVAAIEDEDIRKEWEAELKGYKALISSEKEIKSEEKKRERDENEKESAEDESAPKAARTGDHQFTMFSSLRNSGEVPTVRKESSLSNNF